MNGIVVNSRDLSERKTLEEQIFHQAFHDGLTGLPNRALFLDRLGHALARLTRNVEPLAVLLMDLDNFKVVNDSMGPEAGDTLLAEVAARVKDCVRPQDTVARMGGDEFAVLLEDVQDLKGAVRVAERVTEALEAPFPVGGRELFVSLSIGVAVGATGGESSVELLRAADLALRGAKTSEGGARYRVFEESMDAGAFARLETEDNLRRAIAREELQVHYQPNVSVETEKIVLMEAYARWEHPERGTLEAKEFLAVAEETNLIIPLGEGVLREACRQGAEWQGRYPERVAPKISVNVSRRQLANGQITATVAEILRETGLRPGNLWFDVAEGIVTEDEEISGRLLALRELGVHVAVDNFGVGSSSLSQLRRFPADTLKIDRALISGIDENPQDRAIVAAVVALGRALGRTTIACGVETAEQFAHLKNLGCDLAQGTYFSKPLPADVATTLLDVELGKSDAVRQ
ncbi:putative bifunctional diguanylate cyclase/phosphodiesterase [Rubrobacter marinus]|uniref:putative bifunctional diguanylate cyclase/phosphodiesterase n=1 Tax=Rubrobacter marinus TaxID=2653852 RepID=UPI00140D79ED|nr:EAL domain-containing protein [Rubrobacter marinus]